MADEQAMAVLVESRRQARFAAAYRGGTWYVVQAAPQRFYEVAADFYEPARDRAIVARFDKLAMGTEEVYDARKVQKLAKVAGVPRWTPTLYQTLAEARKAEPGEAFRRRPSRRPRRDPDHPDTPSLEDSGIYRPDYSS